MTQQNINVSIWRVYPCLVMGSSPITGLKRQLRFGVVFFVLSFLFCLFCFVFFVLSFYLQRKTGADGTGLC